MKEHKYAQVLRWIADGKTVQWQDSNGVLHDQDPNQALKEIAYRDWHPDRYRLAPDTITINGIEIEAPFAPAPGQECWAFNMQGHVTAYLYSPGISQDLADNGNCWRTKEAALAAFQAVKSAFTSHKANE